MTYRIRDILRGGFSIAQAERALHSDMIEQRTFDWFCLFAEWAAPRFSGTAGLKQDRFYNRCGDAAFWKRIERVRRLHDRIKDGDVIVAKW